MCVLAQCTTPWLILEKDVRVLLGSLVDIFLFHLTGLINVFQRWAQRQKGSLHFKSLPRLFLAALRPSQPGNEIVCTESSLDTSVLGSNVDTPCSKMFIIIHVTWGSHSEPTFSWWSLGWKMSDNWITWALTLLAFLSLNPQTLFYWRLTWHWPSACYVCPMTLLTAFYPQVKEEGPLVTQP